MYRVCDSLSHSITPLTKTFVFTASDSIDIELFRYASLKE